jgi:hypothetical protein
MPDQVSTLGKQFTSAGGEIAGGLASRAR